MHAVTANPVPMPARTPHPSRRDIARCLQGIRQGDPAAAQALYQAYGASIRLYFRRSRALRDVENAVFWTLVQLVRSVRELDIDEPEELTQTVRNTSAHKLFEWSKTDTANALTLDRRREIVNRLFTSMDRAEREVLFRSSVLLQREDDIAREASVSLTHVRRTQAKARVLFRLCCDDTSNPMAPVVV